MALATETPSRSSVSPLLTLRNIIVNLTLGDPWGTVGRLDEDIATLGAQCDGNGLREEVDTGEESLSSIDAKFELL